MVDLGNKLQTAVFASSSCLFIVLFTFVVTG